MDRSEGSSMAITNAPAARERSAEGLVGRLLQASIGMMDIMSVYLGDRLGLYRALHEGGPSTAAELAARAGIDERYAREWLEEQAGTDPPHLDDVGAPLGRRPYPLPPAHAAPPLRPRRPPFIAPPAPSTT